MKFEELLAALPGDALVPVAWVREHVGVRHAASLAALLADLEDGSSDRTDNLEELSPPPAQTWREKLWTAPAETRLGVSELSEAMGRPVSWIYRRTAKKRKKPRYGQGVTDRLPHRKLGGELLFTAGEVRAWLRGHEDVIEAGPMESTPAEHRLRAM